MTENAEPTRRVIRVKVGAGVGAGVSAPTVHAPITRTPRPEETGHPELKLVSVERDTSSVPKELRDAFTKGDLGLTIWRAGYDKVIWRTTQASSVKPWTAKPHPTTLSIMPYAYPSPYGTRGGSMESIAIGSDEIELSRGGGAYIESSWVKIVSDTKMHLIFDEMHNRIGVAGQDWLIILLDVVNMRSKTHMVDVVSYIVDKYMQSPPITGKPASKPDYKFLMEVDEDEVVELFRKAYSKVKDTQAAGDARRTAKAQVKAAFDNYRRLVNDHGDKIKYLEGAKDTRTDEDLKRLAKQVLKNMTDNILVSGVRVMGRNLRVITKPIQGLDKYWGSAEKRIIITIPLYHLSKKSERSETAEYAVNIKELSLTNGVRLLPQIRGHIYETGNICLGSLWHSIDVNILSGDWDMALMLILRGLMGADRLKSEMKRHRSILEQVRKRVKEEAKEDAEEPPSQVADSVPKTDASGGEQ